MIYTVGGIKGGSGKTTIAINLTIYLAGKGREVLLVDADDQETATDFTMWRNERTQGSAGYTAIQLANEAVRTEILKLSKKYHDVVIDTGGRDTTSQRAALTISDVYIVPFVPRSFDIWTLEKVTKLIQEISLVNPRLYPVAFLNRMDSRGADNDEAAALLKESAVLNFIEDGLCSRKAFANSATMGMGILELKPRDPKAEEEFEAIMKRIMEIETMLAQGDDAIATLKP